MSLGGQPRGGHPQEAEQPEQQVDEGGADRHAAEEPDLTEMTDHPGIHQPQQRGGDIENTMGRARANTARWRRPSRHQTGVSMSEGIRCSSCVVQPHYLGKVRHHARHDDPGHTALAQTGRNTASSLRYRIDQHNGGGVVDQVILLTLVGDGVDEPQIAHEREQLVVGPVAALNSGLKKAV